MAPAPSASSAPTISIGIPATKYCAAQTQAITSDMPMSGCSARMAMMVTQRPAETPTPGRTGSRRPAAISQAETMMKVGFRNSDGCSDSGPTRSQRDAPLTSYPTTWVATVASRATPNSATA